MRDIIFQAEGNVFRVRIILQSEAAENFLSYLQNLGIINSRTSQYIGSSSSIFTCQLRDKKIASKVKKKAKALKVIMH